MKNLLNQVSKQVIPSFMQRKTGQLDELFEKIKVTQLHLGAPNGVYRTERWVYEAILDLPERGDVTLETGAGASSLCFARSQSSKHFILSPDPQDMSQIQEFARVNGESLSKIEFCNQSSVEVLPQFKENLAVALVDGCHGPFLPFLDFYYCAKNLVANGHILIDDIHLFAPKMVFEFVKREPSVEVVHATDRAALVRIKDTSFIDFDWWQSSLAYQFEGEVITDELLEKANAFKADH